VVGGVAGFRRPFFRFAAGALITAPRRRDFNRGDALERADLLGDLDGGDDCRLRVNHRGIGLQRAAMNTERHAAPAEGLNLYAYRAGDLLEKAGAALEDRRRTGEALAREQRGKHRVAASLGIGEPLPIG